MARETGDESPHTARHRLDPGRRACPHRQKRPDLPRETPGDPETVTTLRLQDALAAFDTTFRAGDGARFEAFFTEDSRLFFHEQPPIEGRAAIGAAYRNLFADVDTSAYQPDYHSIDVHGDTAYVIADFRETLRPWEAGSSVLVHGRIVLFWRREPDGVWRVTRLLTSRSAPEEELPG